MEAPQPTSSFTSEANRPGTRPHTPPYTPHRYGKQRFERSDSPASSIHPTETTSPGKHAATRLAVTDNVKVEELAEGDLGYHTDIDVVYPGGLEEVDSDSLGESTATEEEGDDDDMDDESEPGIAQRLSRLRCGEGTELDFEKERRRRHLIKRTGSRLFKRSHSQSVKSDAEATDMDAMNDHDVKASQRRLRRRVRGPEKIETTFEDIPREPPRSATTQASTAKHHTGPATPAEVEDSSSTSDEMDIDDGN